MSKPLSSSEPSIYVGRWVNTFCVPAGHPSPGQLDHCLQETLARSCSTALAGLIEPSDPAVWRIRELKMAFCADISFHSDDFLARVLAEHLAADVGRILLLEGESDSVLRFENRAAYLARFVADLAEGRAWGKWYYDEFDSLCSLSLSQAICEIFTREPDQAATVILRLASNQQLEPVISQITENDALRIYEAVFVNAAGESGVSESIWVGRILELWNERPLFAAVEPPRRWRDALRLLARTVLRFAGAETLAVAKTVLEGLLELRQVLMRLRSPVLMDRLITALANQDLTAALGIAEREGGCDSRKGLEFFMRTIAGDSEWGQQAAGIILGERYQDASARARTVPGGEPLLTHCGGVFLLGPSFIELDVERIIATGMSSGRNDEVASVFRHLLAVKCLGRLRANEAMSDAALSFFSGFRGRGFLGAASVQMRPEPVMSALVQNLSAQGRCEGRCIFAEVVPLSWPVREVLLIRDLTHNQWVYLAENAAGHTGDEEVLTRGLELISGATGNAAEVLMLGGRLGALNSSSILRSRASRLLSLDTLDTFPWEALAAQFSVRPDRLLRAARSVEADLSGFSLADIRPEIHFDPGLDLAGTLVARSLLRHFSGKLSGFEFSSPEYLYQNFLSGVCVVRITVERIEVQYPRCPISVVLHLSGVWDQTYALPWLQGKEICLRPPPK